MSRLKGGFRNSGGGGGGGGEGTDVCSCYNMFTRTQGKTHRINGRVASVQCRQARVCVYISLIVGLPHQTLLYVSNICLDISTASDHECASRRSVACKRQSRYAETQECLIT